MRNKKLPTKMFLLPGIVYLLILAGCGGNTSQPPALSQLMAVTVSPSSVTVQTGGVQQFTATVNPSGASQAVTWSLSGVGCTGASCGTIDTTGKYTAPATVPNPPTVVVTVKLVADPTKAGTTTVTIIGVPPAFSLNPSSLAFGNQNVNTTSASRTVTLTNFGMAAAPVNVVGMNGVNFTDFAQTNDCPSVMTAGASCTFSVTFTPTAAGDRIGILNINDGSLLVNLTGTGTGTKIPNNAKLSGQYAFLFSGFNSAGPMSVVGSFTADGNGNLTAGNADVAIVAGTWTNQGLTHSTYSVGSDNLGSMSLNTAVNFPTDNFSFSFSFALESFSASGSVADGGHLTEFDSTDQTGTGFFVRQDPTAFSTAALNGGYAFDLAGPRG